MRYIPHTAADVATMLETIGVADVDALFEAIPEALRFSGDLQVPEALPERDLLAHMGALASANRHGEETLSFLGGGTYRHYRPVAMDQLLLRGELYTAYTPYQPEVAQGTLQIMFEFQSMVAELLGMEVVNASMYDGATSVAEAALMAARVTRRTRVLLSDALHPEYRAVVATYARASGLEIEPLPIDHARGTTDLAALEAAIDGGAPPACVVIGYPTFFGTLDDVAGAADLIHAAGGLLVATFQEALAFGLLEAPGALGADIVAGEGQSLGVPPSFGGPHLGLFACRHKHVRKMPGRLAGETVDDRGNRGFVLTMATREQHIRRERATSNICTNEGLMATAATIYMSLLGPAGLGKIARACHLRMRQVRAALTALGGFEAVYAGPTFHELVVRTPAPAAQIVAELAVAGVAPGVPLSRWFDDRPDELLVTATEITTDEDVARLVEVLEPYGANAEGI